MLWFLASIARGADAVDAARDALYAAGTPIRDGDEIALFPLGGGTRGAVVQVTPSLSGAPVDVSRRVWIDRDGRRHVDAAALPPAIPSAAMTADRALAIARERFGPLPDARARLSWQPRGSSLRLVWTVDAGVPLPGFQVPLVRLDAASGALLAIDEGAIGAAPLANVYVDNPVLDVDTTVVSLPDAALSLSDDRITLQQCRDLEETTTYYFFDGKDSFKTLEVHVCTRVAADGPVDGNYLYTPVPYPKDPARDEDDFAPPHTYYNVHRGLEFFDALGWTVPEEFDPFLYVTVNYRTADLFSASVATDPGSPLVPYDNAYYSGGYFDSKKQWVPPQVVFGQGTEADFAYDADVIHHELGHFVVRTQGGPRRSPDTTEGPSVQANALNEGLADYFSCALQGEPWLAEYADQDKYIRNLSGPETCATDLYGESHYDSLPFSTALWAFRAGLAEEDRPTFDQAVLDGIAIMGPNATFASAADVLIDLAEERLASGGALANAFDARGVRVCRARVAVTPGTEFRRFTQIPSWYEYGNDGPVPGFMQFVVDIPEGGAELTVAFDQSEYLGLDQFGTNVPRPVGVVGRSGDGIEWVVETVKKEFDFGGKTIWLDLEAWTSNAHAVAKSIETGVEPSKTDPRYAMHHGAVRWTVEEPGPYTFQFTNEYERPVMLAYLTLALEPPPSPPEDTGDPPPADVGDESEPEGGCGCGSSNGIGLAWIGALALAISRRASACAPRGTSRSSTPCR